MRSTFCIFLLSCMFLFTFSACKKDTMISEIPAVQSGSYANVPEELWIFFQRFEEEAQERGIFIDLNEEEISAEFMEISEDGVAGTCTYGSHNPGHILIDVSFWDRAGELLKEMIVFHELGHCSLHLDHREGIHPDGTCLSIMRSGLEDCIDNYRWSTRETYLDELFGVL